tara:strand:- start:557632 stop:558960 length:1329 start_codon:yes stop_codon:yes gene_type:complete
MKIIKKLVIGLINRLSRVLPSSANNKLFARMSKKFLFGSTYVKFTKQVSKSEKWNEIELEKYIIKHFNEIFQHAKKMKFYEDKYRKAGVYNLEIKNLDDISRIPLLEKKEIRKNIDLFNGYFKQNTGGTSGNPLMLYLDKNVWAREWAHYYHIWKKFGYKTSDTKFFFRGFNLKDKFLKYDIEHNQYMVNLYLDPVTYIDEFFEVLLSSKCKYFQGYPSAISDFLRKIESKITLEQKNVIKNQVKMCFFNSEYPTPQIIKYLKGTWGLDFMSCYGHSEVCVLAATEKNDLNYFPLHTYAYVEDENNKLIGTSYHNFDMPLIRYDTGDLIRGEKFSNGILKSFEVKEGRIGDFIFDKNNKAVSLTAIFFGRHHKIFNYIDHIQVYQEKNGFATMLITQNKIKNMDASELMELSNINIEFSFKYLNEAVKTKAGKVPLKVLKLP